MASRNKVTHEKKKAALEDLKSKRQRDEEKKDEKKEKKKAKVVIHVETAKPWPLNKEMAGLLKIQFDKVLQEAKAMDSISFCKIDLDELRNSLGVEQCRFDLSPLDFSNLVFVTV